MNHVCLTMIVRNEAATIARGLRAARPHITHWSIVDTGSTDSTREVIKQELAGLPGALHESVWKNFGHNRTESFQLAKQYLVEQGTQLEHAWCLLLDADHELQDHGFDREQLAADSYQLVQTAGYFRYANTRLVRAALDWRSVSVTHEYWAANDAGAAFTLDTLSIYDHEDGGTRSEKLERDERLLRQGLIDEPNNERYHFYLAQTLEDTGDQAKRAEAIELYRKRAAMGGYGEERWMAQYRMGKLLLALGRDREGEAELAIAWQQAPHRAEPLYWLARHHRENGRNHLTDLYARRVKQTPPPHNQALFVERHVYDYGADQELSIAAYYTGDKRQGLLSCERCIEHPSTSEDAQRNIVFYAEPLAPVVERGSVEVPERLLEFDGVKYTPGTNSILNGVMSVRLLNYDQELGQRFFARSPDKRFRTETSLFVPGHEPFVVDASITNRWDTAVSILGLEDWRLFEFTGRMWFVANCCMVPGKRNGPQVALGRLSPDLRKVDHLVAPAYEKANWCEKNWQPLPTLTSEQEYLDIVYSYDPLVVLRCNPATGVTEEIVHGKGPGLPRWRGSAPPIVIGSYLIGIVHDVAYRDSGNVYMHRFVALRRSQLGDTYERVSVSHPFIFEKRGIEYTGGMELEADGLLKIAYTVDEFNTRWLKVEPRVVFEMLGLAYTQAA